MEVAGHEITVAKAATKKPVSPKEDQVIKPESTKVVSANVSDLNNMFFLIVKTYENGEIFSKIVEKTKAKSENWKAIH